MQRSTDSHKGDNGKVAVIGGSKHMHGAPILAALAAEAAGVDLVYLALPKHHACCAKEYSPNFQVHPFTGEDIGSEDVKHILELMADLDCAVIGPGIARESEQVEVLLEIIDSAVCPLVLDATALQSETLKLITGKSCVITPHLGELERMELNESDLATTAKSNNVTILLKGERDHIYASDGSQTEISGGNAGLTVGGTGDALAGLTAGLIALRVSAADAAETASKILKRAGTVLYPEKGYAYTAMDVIEQIPNLLHSLHHEND